MGLSDRNEWVGLHREFDNCGSHYVEGKGNLRLSRVDDLDLMDCDLIALDVEGYEFKALLGANHTIQTFKPTIVCEEKGLSDKYGVYRDAIKNLLSDFGYKISDKVGNDVIYIV